MKAADRCTLAGSQVSSQSTVLSLKPYRDCSAEGRESVNCNLRDGQKNPQVFPNGVWYRAYAT